MYPSSTSGNGRNVQSRSLRSLPAQFAQSVIVNAEMMGDLRVMLHHHGDVAHQLAEFGWQPIQRRDDHFLETTWFDLDHRFYCPALRPARLLTLTATRG
jgi:hypothetical protein